MSDKKELLKFLEHEKEYSDSRTEKNTKDGYPEAAAGWLERSNKFGRWIDLVEKQIESTE